MVATVENTKTRDYREYNFSGSGYSVTVTDDWKDLSKFIPVPEPTERIRVAFRGVETEWTVDYMISERKIKRHYVRSDDAFVREAVAKCVVTQVEGPEIGRHGFMKIWAQIPNNNGKPNKPYRIGRASRKELEMLMTCTSLQMKCTPRLLGFGAATQGFQHPYPGGYIWYVVMEELPGKDLRLFSQMSLEDRDGVRLAAARAIRELKSYSFDHKKPGDKHLIWDKLSKRCWFVGLQDLKLVNRPPDDMRFIPRIDWQMWWIDTTHSHPCCYTAPDPTIAPLLGPSVGDLDDEVMEQTMRTIREKSPSSPGPFWSTEDAEQYRELYNEIAERFCE